MHAVILHIRFVRSWLRNFLRSSHFLSIHLSILCVLITSVVNSFTVLSFGKNVKIGTDFSIILNDYYYYDCMAFTSKITTTNLLNYVRAKSLQGNFD